ncbi:NitT/TauT family transport system substrate-binding protein [Desulfocicer vacuolatum DSM 3385]|uniref:NitT/TauT family transport system substrate-binding protein n=1 Tax=Desulfocicer vacuolatum DSM 3385 TaxID=1121400 RepID=A0A1W2BDC8_9BACT|nr:ABC transporter substrate-binding protein [Desulfocicer vacuolatum]SMC70896.1 NitT/TauT family transport system substrate-binding protein [Desulfocicer vacuolatum DSM 3385]
MEKTIIVVNVLLLICINAGCADKIEEIKKNASIRIVLNPWPGYAHLFIAKEKGYFKENNVDIELVFKEDATISRETYKNGEVDGICMLLPDVIMLNVQNIPTKIVYVADYSNTGDVIIGRDNYNSLTDLKGKTVSFEGINTFSHMFVLKALENVGLSEIDVRFKNVIAGDVLKALKEGRIDAGHTWSPTKVKALNAGYKILGTAGDTPGVITDVLAFSSKVIKKRPAKILAVVKSILQARAFVHTNKQEAIAIMAKAESMSEAEMLDGIDGVYQPDLQGNVEAMKKKENMTSIYYSGEHVVRFFLNRGQLSHEPNLDEMIEPGFINELAGNQIIKK